MEEIPAILKIATDVFNLLKRPIFRLRVLKFQVWNRLSPAMDPDTAINITFATLGGSVIAALPFRDFGNPHRQIAALWKRSDKDPGFYALILEEFAGGWRLRWQSDNLFDFTHPAAFQLADFDGDGQHEISFHSASYGTGGATEIFHLYVPKRAKVYSVTYSVMWADLRLPRSPQITLEPAGDEAGPVFWRGLEKVCSQVEISLGQQLEHVDLDDPRNAVLRWHKENGELTHGEVKIHLYEGSPPADNSTTVVQVEDGDLVWTSYFKYAVYGYIRPQDKHFVVYSPGFAWSWASCLLATTNYLWIGTRGDGLLRFDKVKHFLFQFKEVQTNELREVDSFEKEGDFFIINGTLRVPAALLEEEWPGMDEILHRIGGGQWPPML